VTKQEMIDLRQDANDTLDSVKTVTKQNYTAIGASMGILAYTEGMPVERDATHYAKDELEAAETYHDMKLDNMASDELRHAEYWLEQGANPLLRQKYATLRSEIGGDTNTPADPKNATVDELTDIQRRMKAVDLVPNSEADEKRIESLMYFAEYFNRKTAERMDKSEEQGQFAETAFRMMLECDYEVFGMLMKTADVQEQKIARAYFKKMAEL